MSADVHKLLSRLDKVKPTGNGRWEACCPAHDDKSPSLSITLADDGKLLVHCWAGCPAADAIGAVGLTMADLFPERDRCTDGAGPMPASQRWVRYDVLKTVASEALLVALAAETLYAGKELAPDDLERLAAAAGRLRDAAREVGCYDR